MKKLQVFISSTYIDLKDERQAAVESILDAGHIPAGMELFKAGNETQLKTINKWIDESDVYMLILGGRYGSIEPITSKSYTHLEYEYAINKGKPVFAVVLSEPTILKKASEIGRNKAMEQDEISKYEDFKSIVLSKMIRHVEDLKDIKLAVHTTLNEFSLIPDLSGWIKGSEVDNSVELLRENNKLIKENKKLKDQLDKIKKVDLIGSYNFKELKELLESRRISIPSEYFEDGEDRDMTYKKFIELYKDKLVTGITNSMNQSKLTKHIYYKVLPILVTFGLLEKVKIAGVSYERIQASKDGLKFIARLELEEARDILQ